MAQRTPEEEKEQQGTVRERMRDSLRKGVDSRREGREQRSTARKEKRSERQETRQQRKPERQEERTAGKLAYSEAREQGQGVVPAMRQRRQEKMRQRLENLRGRQQPTPVAPPASQAEALEYLDPMIETRAYPQRLFAQSPSKREMGVTQTQADAANPAYRKHYSETPLTMIRDSRKHYPPGLTDMTPEQLREMEEEVARTDQPGKPKPTLPRW